jgi:hypothetical protein
LTAATPRTETRTITCTSNVADLDFPCVYQAFRVHRETFDLHGNPLRTETAYGIASLTAHQANPADIAAFVRGQWQIEVRHEVALVE